MSKDVKFIIGASIAVLVIGLVIFFIIKKYRQDITRDIKVDESKLSYEQSQYKLWASQLKTAMDGLATDESAIYRILQQIKNQDDWNQLVKAFGINDGETLLDWLGDDLSESEYNKCIDILSKVNVSI